MKCAVAGLLLVASVSGCEPIEEGSFTPEPKAGTEHASTSADQRRQAQRGADWCGLLCAPHAWSYAVTGSKPAACVCHGAGIESGGTL